MTAVLGAGIWGTALATVLAKTSPEKQVLFWGRNSYTKHSPDLILPNNIEFTTDLSSVLAQTTDLLLTVPSCAFTDLLQTIKHLKPKNLILNQLRISWATKGLDATTGKFFSQIIEDLFGANIPIAMLSGPSFAQEVINEIPTFVVIAGRNSHLDQLFVKDLIKQFNSKLFRAYMSNDIIGVQLGGVLKNVLAVASGILDGLKFGSNTKAGIITRGLAEGMRLAECVNGNRHTLMGLSGIGDLFLSCSDHQSRNRKFGLLLASGLTIEQAKLEVARVIEALDNVQKLYELAIYYKLDLPIIGTMWQIMIQNMPVQPAIATLLFKDLNNVEPQFE